MTFENPKYLYLLLTILLVILIHLLNLQKFKKVYFSNIKLLNQVIKEQRKKSKLKNVFLLLLRSLIVACLVFAFAQFFLENKNAIKTDKVSIFIDNSKSTSRKLGEPTILSLQKKYAIDIVKSIKANAIQVLTNNHFSGKYTKFITKQEAIKRIQNIDFTNYRQEDKAVLNKIEQTDTTNKSIFILSDFQKNQFTLSKKSDNNKIYWVNFHALQTDNVSILKVEKASPISLSGKETKLYVTLKNYGKEARNNIPVKLFLGENQKTKQEVDLEAFETKKITLSFLKFKEDSPNVKITLEDLNYTFDNEFYTVLSDTKKYSISLITNNQNTAFAKLFRDKEFDFEVYTENSINYKKLEQADLIIVDALTNWSTGLASAIKDIQKDKRVNVLINPSKNTAINTFLNTLNIPAHFNNWRTESININTIVSKHPLYYDVFDKKEENIQQVKVDFYGILNTKNTGQNILQYSNEKSFLKEYKANKSSVFLYTSNINKSSFVKHSLFVPTTLNMAYLNGSKSRDYIIGKDNKVLLNRSVNNTIQVFYKEKPLETSVMQFNQEKYLLLDDYFDKTGFVAVNDNVNLSFGLNQNVKESEMDFYTPKELEKIASKELNTEVLSIKNKNWNTFIKNQSEEKDNWLNFIYLALFLYLIEMIFIIYQNRK